MGGRKVSEEEVRRVEREIAMRERGWPDAEPIPVDDDIRDPGIYTMAGRKRQVVEALEPEKYARKAQRRRERQCFWAWPLGHVWKCVINPGPHWSCECRVCGKTAVRP